MKKILLCLCTLVLLIPSVNARVINVADHGIVPGKDVSFQLNNLLESVKNEADVTISFPKGQYDFHPENAVEAYRYVANHDNGLKRMAFPLFDMKNITIDGNGSLFMFHGRIVPFTVERANKATLKNFTIDFIRSFHAELDILESNNKDKSFVAFVDEEKYPFVVKNGEILFERFGQWDPIGSNIVIDKKTRAPIFNTNKYKINGAKVTKIGKNKIKIEKLGKGTPPPVGSIAVVYGVHPTSRLTHAIQITNSKDIKIQDVTVLDGGGMALIVERTENIHLNRYKVTSGPGRIVATRADASHFIGCKGTILVENSLVEHMLDDGINVHGAYVNIDSYLGNNEFIASISHFQQMGLVFAEPGDKVALLSRTTVLPFFETEITKVKPINEKRFVLTMKDVPANLPKGPLSIENLTWNPDLIFRNNIVRENRARSILVTTKGKVLIENNYLSSQMHGILIEGDNNKWYESGAVKDITIRNNTFVNIGYSGRAAYPLYAAPLLNKTQHFGEGFYHRNINFVNNTIKSFNGLVAFSQSVDGLNISNNTVEFSKDYPEVTQYPAIDIRYSDNVKIEKNKAKYFDRELNIVKSQDSGKVTVNKNQGIAQ